MSDIAIKVENLSKRYRIGLKDEIHDTFAGALTSFIRSPVQNLRRLRRLSIFEDEAAEDIIWALKDVSFEVQRGEVLGIIGRNGAGKSTLLKILSRITHPTSGRVELHGRVSSLLEVGTGFHPELTGRENIYLNGTILGMRKAEIDRKFDEIVSFSGVEKYIYTPVKFYSSGMRVRLAFSVAAYLEPEILLIDEVLAVGDAEFQKKCLGKMGEVAREGRTVLFVSHNMASIQSLCSKNMVLNSGQVEYLGSTQDAIDIYLSNIMSNQGVELDKREILSDAWYTGIYFSSNINENINAVISGDLIDINLTYRVKHPELKLDFAIGIYNTMGEKILHLATSYSNLTSTAFYPCGKITCRIPKLPLPRGRYLLNLSLHCNKTRVDHLVGAATLDVEQGDFYGTGKVPPATENKVLIEHNWLISENDKSKMIDESINYDYD